MSRSGSLSIRERARVRGSHISLKLGNPLHPAFSYQLDHQTPVYALGINPAKSSCKVRRTSSTTDLRLRILASR